MNYVKNQASSAQLSIAMRKVQLLYLAGVGKNSDRIVAMLKWILQSGCNDNIAACTQVQNEAILLIHRLQAGVDYFGECADQAINKHEK